MNPITGVYNHSRFQPPVVTYGQNTNSQFGNRQQYSYPQHYQQQQVQQFPIQYPQRSNKTEKPDIDPFTKYGSQQQVKPVQTNQPSSNNNGGGYRNAMPKGLKNIGNNCYMNALLQSLYSLNNFRQAIRQLDSKDNLEVSITSQLQFLFMALEELNDWSSCDPTDFYKSFLLINKNFRFGCQEDAHEFLLCLFQGLINENNTPKKVGIIDKMTNFMNDKPKYELFWQSQRERENSIISDLFVGVMTNTIKCRQCRHEQIHYEEFNNINITLDNTQKQCQLNELLQIHFREQPIKQYVCPQCKQQSSYQQLRIIRVPMVLIFQFKRFMFNNDQTRRINTSIIFPINQISLGQYTQTTFNLNYELQSIVHQTGTCEYGHYYATCKDQRTGNWYRYDDSQVEQINIKSRQYDTFGTGTPYMLIYTKL